VRINGDIALFKGLAKEIIEKDRAAGGALLAHDFIATQTEGFDALVRDLDATSWDEIVKESGVTREQIAEGAAIALAAERIDVLWAMGHHPARQRRRQREEHRQLRAAARADRAPRRRRRAHPRATATCRAIAPSASGRR
jgi:anaerobic selenocysteine-containing dehydrogenase